MKSIQKKKARFKEGDRSRAMCPTCRTVCIQTFKKSTLKVKGISIPDVLMGFCNRCGNYVSLPHQSVEDIKNRVKR